MVVGSAAYWIQRGRVQSGRSDVLVLRDQVFVAWQEFDGKETSVHVMDSADGGRTFGPARRLAAAASAADYPRLVDNGRQAFVSWYAADSGYQLLPTAPSAAP